MAPTSPNGWDHPLALIATYTDAICGHCAPVCGPRNRRRADVFSRARYRQAFHHSAKMGHTLKLTPPQRRKSDQTPRPRRQHPPFLDKGLSYRPRRLLAAPLWPGIPRHRKDDGDRPPQQPDTYPRELRVKRAAPHRYTRAGAIERPRRRRTRASNCKSEGRRGRLQSILVSSSRNEYCSFVILILRECSGWYRCRLRCGIVESSGSLLPRLSERLFVGRRATRAPRR